MTSPMTLLQAAQHVLTLAGTPLHTEELSRRMLEGGFWTTQAQTPYYSVYSALYLSIKRQGLSSPFMQTAPSTFGLRASPTATPVVHPETGTTDDGPPVGRTFLDVAEAVLAALPAGQPMRIRDLTDTALRDGLLVTQGLTPAATMSAQIYQDVERRRKRGLPPRFERLQNGFVRLHASGQDARPDRTARPVVFAELPKQLWSMNPQRLGGLIEQLLAALGYVPVEVTRVDDDGIDLRVESTAGLVPERLAVRVNRRGLSVQRPAIQELRERLAPHERGLFITLNSFTADARDEAARPGAAPVGLLSGDALVNLLVEHRIGVREEEGDLVLHLTEEDPAPVTDPFDEHLSPIVRDRIAAGLCVSAIDSEGGDANIWGLDDAEELELSRQHMAELRLRVELAELEQRGAAATPTETVDILIFDAAMQHYDAIRLEEEQAHPTSAGEAGPPGQTLWRMAQLTWPFQVMRFGSRYTVFFVRGQGMEDELWTLKGARAERDAIMLSVILRNLFAEGNRDALRQGRIHSFLGFALPEVRVVNAAGQTLTPDEG